MKFLEQVDNGAGEKGVVVGGGWVKQKHIQEQMVHGLFTVKEN